MKAGSKGSRLKALPWAALLQVGVAFGKRWRGLSERDRARLTQLTRERLRLRNGRLGNLSSRERDELRKLLRKLDVKGMGREMITQLRGTGRRRRR
jgi:hypothetical protein